MTKPTDERAGAFPIESPNQSGNLRMSTNVAEPSQLFDLLDPNAPRPPQSRDIPERIVLADEEGAIPQNVLDALERVVERFNKQGQIGGRDASRHTHENKFDTRYRHPYVVADGMDAGGLPLLTPRRDSDGKPLASLPDLDVLNETARRLAAGESEEDVIKSRERIAYQLEQKLGPGATYQVEPGSSIEVPVDAKYRKQFLANSAAVQRLVASLRLGSI